MKEYYIKQTILSKKRYTWYV